MLELACIVGLYAAAAAIAHWASARAGAGAAAAGRRRHYALVAGNEERRIEGCVRALRRSAAWSGREALVTVVLRDSTDGTAAIAERLARDDGHGGGIVRVMAAEAAAAGGDVGMPSGARAAVTGIGSERTEWFDLSRSEDVRRLRM